MSRFELSRSYVPSSTGKSKLLKYVITDSATGEEVKTLSDKAKAEALLADLNTAAEAEVALATETEEPQVEEAAPGTVAVPEKESPAQEARRKAHELGFNKYAIRRYRYYQHLVGDEHMKEEDAKAAAATATRHTLWPFRMTREELRASA